ncbi:MAG: thiamine phosphate synthase [Cyanobacteria bacterium P01_A01_bin.114]
MSSTPSLTPQQTLFRILDANLDRAREGIRTIEEWCRFGLNDGSLTEKCKHWRQTLAVWHTAEIRAARDTPGDPGTVLSHSQEESRSTLESVLQANFCRVQEALRTLEEYGKLQSTEMAAACKQMRYQFYALESQLLARGPDLHKRQQRLQRLMRSHLYLVTSPTEAMLTVVEAALKGGVDIVQYREKKADDCQRLPLAQKMCALCHRYDALFIVNDRVDLALAVDADGVHLGQQDLPIQTARALLGPGCIIGRSTTNPDEMSQALAEGADYIGVGPVNETPTKPGKAAAGLDYVRYAAEQSTVPWFAIGGINLENISSVVAAGAGRIAVVRAIMQADDPAQVSQNFVAKITSAPRQSLP